MKNYTRFTKVLIPFITIVILLIQSCAQTSKTKTQTPDVPTPSPTPLSIQEVSTPEDLTQIKSIDPCTVFTNAQVEPIVGTALITTTPGTDTDEITGGPLVFCTYQGDDVALVLSIAKSQAAQDSQVWQNQLAAMTVPSEPGASIKEGAGLGEKAYWIVNEDSASWFVASYPYVFGLAVGGNISLAEEYKEDLKILAQQVLDSLP